MSKKEGRETRIVKAGRRKEWTSAIVNPPIYRASTILFDNVAALRAAKPEQGVFYYGRQGTPTTWALETALTEMEPGAAGTRLYPSGVAATATALMSVLRAGDELLMVDSAYEPTRIFCETVLKRMNIAVRYYDPLVGAGIEALIGDKTRAIFLESPGSLTFEVQDVPAICAVARERGISTLIDNTWATSYFLQPIELGVDLSIVAATKYIVGHSDVMIGSVTANDKHWPKLVQTSRGFGQTASPDDAYLTLRGLRTLGVRLRQHEENALAVARWLKDQPQVARVLHPALPDCPGHDQWARDFKGSTGLFAFVLNGGGDADRTRFIDGLSHFGIGYSWGGYESLVLPVDPKSLRSLPVPEWEGPLVRLHIGLEDVDDLIADLGEGLAAYGASA